MPEIKKIEKGDNCVHMNEFTEKSTIEKLSSKRTREVGVSKIFGQKDKFIMSSRITLESVKTSVS